MITIALPGAPQRPQPEAGADDMRVLSVTPFPLLPTSHGSRARAWGFAHGMALAGATVDVICPWTPPFPMRAVSSEGVTIHRHLLPANLLPLVVSERLVPPLVMLSWQPFAAGPRRLLSRFRGYDVVEFHLCATANWMGKEPRGARVVYVAHNVERDFHRLVPRTKLASGPAMRALDRLEARAVAASDLIVTCTEADAARLRELDGTTTPMLVVPQASDVRGGPGPDARAAVRRQLGIADDELALVFVGGPAHHNRSAVAYLEDEVLPRLRRPARLLAVGRCADGNGGAPSGRTLRLGYVDDVAPLLAAADVGVNPITAGSGTNCKVALYLAAGLPTLTTPIGLRGYEPMASECMVAELDRFADVLDAVPLRDASAARPTAVPDWRAAGATLLAAYERLLA